ncbi:alternate-type signal peptide domain-containing protein [Microbacterium sp. NPDC091313]
MNKLAKGSLAGAAGVVLLLGGAGTFAYWNAQAGVVGGTVAAGQLSLVDDGAQGVWTDQNDAVIDPATYRIVPGDVLTYTDDLTLVAVGDNIRAELTLAGGAIAPTTPGDAEDVALASFLQDSAVLTATGGNIVAGTPANTFTVTEGTATVTTTITLAFPFGSDTTNNSAQLGSVNLSDMAISLVQTEQ